MGKLKKFIVLVFGVLVYTSFIGVVYAEPLDTELPTKNLVFKEAVGFLDDEKLLYGIDTPEYAEFENAMADAIVQDISEGYDEIIKKKNVNSHIPMERYGEFLYKTANKEVSEMTSTLPLFAWDEYNIEFNGDRTTKAWIVSFLNEVLPKKVEEFNNSHNLVMYTVDLSTPMALSDFNIDNFNSRYRQIAEYKPLSGLNEELDTLYFHNTGNTYGLSLNSDFSDILNGASDNLGIYERLSINTVLVIKTDLVVPATESEDFMKADFSKVNNYGVNLRTHEIYDTDALNTDMNKVLGTPEDLGLDSSELIVFSVKDGVLVAPRYLYESFNYNNTTYMTSAKIDMMSFYAGDTSNVNISFAGNTLQESIKTYIGDGVSFMTDYIPELGIATLQTDSNNAPILRYMQWANSSEGVSALGDKWEQFRSDIKPLAKKAGLYNEFKEYMGSDVNIPLIVVVVIMVIGSALGVIYTMTKKKKGKGNSDYIGTVEADEYSENMGVTPKIRHSSKLRGLASNVKSDVKSNNTNTVSDITDSTGFTSFEYDDEDTEFTDFEN